MPTSADGDWSAARAAVATSAARVTSLLRTVRLPEAPAVGQWNVTDVAAHLSHTVDAIFGMAKGGGNVLDDLWDLSKLTTALVQGERTRDLDALADRIDASTRDFLAYMDAAPDDALRAWLVKGVEVPLSTLTCHALNELTVHGYDIAKADGVPWPIERSHAALVVNRFLFPALGGLGTAMIDQDVAAGLRACLEVRVRGGSRVYLRFDDGDFSVDASPWKRIDCHLSVDPVAFMLVAWGRIDQWGAIGRGQLVAWGRRPWLGLKLRALLRNP